MDLSGVTLTGLRVVRQAAASGSFTGAADALGYTQSAVSRQIAAMETAVGTPLFERAPRGVQPTEAGALLVQHAGSALAVLDDAAHAVMRLQARLEGRVSLGAVPVAMSVLVPRALARVVRLDPELEVTLQEAPTPTLIERIRGGVLDVAVIGVGEDLPGYDLEGLRRDLLLIDTLRVAVSREHRLAARASVPVAELRHEPWIVGQTANPGEPSFGTWPTLRDPVVAYASREWPARLGLVAAGLGIALIPNIGAESIPAGVVAIDVVDPAHRPRSAVALTAEGAPPAAQAVVNSLRTEAARIAMTASQRPST